MCSNPVAIERLRCAGGSNHKNLLMFKLERRLATRYLDDVFASIGLLSITRFYQSRGLLAAICRIKFTFKVEWSSVAHSVNKDNNSE